MMHYLFTRIYDTYYAWQDSTVSFEKFLLWFAYTAMLSTLIFVFYVVACLFIKYLFKQMNRCGRIYNRKLNAYLHETKSLVIPRSIKIYEVCSILLMLITIVTIASLYIFTLVWLIRIERVGYEVLVSVSIFYFVVFATIMCYKGLVEVIHYGI